MQLIHDVKSLSSSRQGTNTSNWTAIIPAAGRGSRLQFAGPKLLFPVLGKPILTWLVELLTPFCRDLIFVCSSDGSVAVKPLLNSLRNRARVAIQDRPTGMGDAIALCEGMVKTSYTMILWGDQITPRATTLAACMTLLESSSSIHAVIPTMERDTPYIHFKRDMQGRITEVYQARETDERLPRGESDCGLFCFRTDVLFHVLKETRGAAEHQGAKTGENNFLSLIPLFDRQEGALMTVRLQDPNETIGINTAEDAETVGRIMKERLNERR